ncbi:diguanylate cyclase domain-containing protein [Desulfobulbus alkaliphilus]|uniref:diguanylate cyclase domain-containing protein n=1 Tax=Desulfobulbus alkaliphilus TaxID=869814 RepID=UPI0019647126|nr:diguanylate cyclase [Desulfobulbus alkaliphilus]MBM9538691.1 diguanylate cyclase [Desulfobulbus alkaliphilus]
MKDYLALPRPVVLIVDDQPVNIHALASLLREDYTLLAAASGTRALELAKGEKVPDLILLDIMMPAMNGYEVCRQLKNDPKTKDIPVIFITARSDSEDEAMGLDLGAVDYIAKPFNNAVVRARVRTHLKLKTHTDMLEKLAMVDGLTGVANRRSFDRALEMEWRRTARSGQAVSIVMIDIDHFKEYNDHYGHGAGDDILQRIAGTLSTVIKRLSDLLARYGGEEFVVLLPETDAGGAGMLADSIRQAVVDLALPHDFSPVAKHITISAGYATQRASPNCSPRHLLGAADQALYTAKKTGRNRVCAG